MASEDTLEPATQESTQDEPETSESETQQGESETEDIEQLRAERDQYKRDYAALKQDYDKNARESKRTKVEPVHTEDETLWLIENANALKMCKAEYAKHMSELTALGAKPTFALKQKALELAKFDKGLLRSDSGESERQSVTSSPTQGETRSVKTKPKLTETQRDNKWFKEEWLEKYPELAKQG